MYIAIVNTISNCHFFLIELTCFTFITLCLHLFHYLFHFHSPSFPLNRAQFETRSTFEGSGELVILFVCSRLHIQLISPDVEQHTSLLSKFWHNSLLPFTVVRNMTALSPGNTAGLKLTQLCSEWC